MQESRIAKIDLNSHKNGDLACQINFCLNIEMTLVNLVYLKLKMIRVGDRLFVLQEHSERGEKRSCRDQEKETAHT